MESREEERRLVKGRRLPERAAHEIELFLPETVGLETSLKEPEGGLGVFDPVRIDGRRDLESPPLLNEEMESDGAVEHDERRE